jgi:hypothetical protein
MPFICASVGVGIRLKGWSAYTFAIMGVVDFDFGCQKI